MLRKQKTKETSQLDILAKESSCFFLRRTYLLLAVLMIENYADLQLIRPKVMHDTQFIT